MLVRKEHANEMAVADMGKAPTAVRKPKNQKSRDITTFEEGPNTSERNRHVAAQPTAASAAGTQATFICGGFFGLWFRFRVCKREKLSLLCLRRKTTREKTKKGEGYFVSCVESTNLT